MTKMLASVCTLTEAMQALAADVAIIDLKQPAQGALGALPLPDIIDIVHRIKGRCPVSATLGDLPMQPAMVYEAALAMSATGVDYIKIGFFPGGDWQGCLAELSLLAKQNTALIAVLFADSDFNVDIIPSIKAQGFTGVMLDTRDKNSGSLRENMSADKLREFVSLAKTQGLLCGLAGSLRYSDIEALKSYGADYLGFRGALCESHKRTGSLNEGAMLEIRKALAG